MEAQAVTDRQLQALAQRVEELAQAQARTEQRVEELAQAQARTERRVEELAQAQARTEQRVEELAQALTALTAEVRELRRDVEGIKVDLAQLKVEVHGLKNDVGLLKGDALERHYREFGPAYFSTVVRRPRVLSRAALADLLDAAVDERRITEEEQHEVLLTNVVLTGQRRDDRQPVYVAVEVSSVIDVHDVSRAQYRALTLQKLGQPTIPVVAGHFVLPDADAVAQASGIWRVLNGRRQSPEA
jgi:archaellum component FlaC